MKLFLTLIFSLFIAVIGYSQPYISKIVFSGIESSRGVQITNPDGDNLSNWSLVFYEGTNKNKGKILEVSGNAFPSTSSPLIWIAFPEISIGHPKGAAVALVDNEDKVTQFLSYNGDSSFEVKGGLAEDLETTYLGDFTGEEEENGTIVIVITVYIPEGTAGEELDNNEGIISLSSNLSVVKNEIEGFKVYPNPVLNNEIYISTPNKGVKKQIEVYNVNGQQLLSKNSQVNGTIDVSGLTTGFYIIRVVEDGNIATRKLIVN